MADREPYPSEKQDRFIVRLPDGMRDRIKAAAEANSRSMNAEIVATLEEKYPAPLSDDDLRKLINVAMRMFSRNQPDYLWPAIESNRRAMLFVLKHKLGSKDPEADLQRIETSNIDTSDVTIDDFVHWITGLNSEVEAELSRRASKDPVSP